MGYRPIRSAIQKEGLDQPLRNGLWNVISRRILSVADVPAFAIHQRRINFYQVVWIEYFKQRADIYKEYQTNHSINAMFYSEDNQWHAIYDFIEFCLERFDFHRLGAAGTREDFIKDCNECLTREMSAYRIVGGQVVPITSEEEIVAIDEAAALGDLYEPVAAHIKRAIELLSDRTAPDYRNSIKEAISAVEGICAIITESPKATLGDALKKLTDKGIELHPALKDGFSKLYGYTSDAQGIRHALMDKPNLDFEDAKFMLVSCSAFVNLLKAKAP
jgi:hypothetical protein